jgi:hypothetical protein
VSGTWGEAREGYGSQEFRGEGVTVSGTWGEGYGGQKLGVRVSKTLVENYGDEGKMRVVEVRDLGSWGEAHENYIS